MVPALTSLSHGQIVQTRCVEREKQRSAAACLVYLLQKGSTV